MQRQTPKPKKKPKKAVINGRKQKNKFRKPQSIAISQPEQAKGAQTEVPRIINNNKKRRNGIGGTDKETSAIRRWLF